MHSTESCSCRQLTCDVQLFWFVPQGAVYLVQYAQLEQPTQPAVTGVVSSFEAAPGGRNDPFAAAPSTGVAAAPGKPAIKHLGAAGLPVAQVALLHACAASLAGQGQPRLCARDLCSKPAVQLQQQRQASQSSCCAGVEPQNVYEQVPTPAEGPSALLKRNPKCVA